MSETLEEIAERVTNEWYLTNGASAVTLADLILSALREQTERCAEIAEKCHPQPCICQTCLIHAEAGAAIRKLLRLSGKDSNKDASQRTNTLHHPELPRL